MRRRGTGSISIDSVARGDVTGVDDSERSVLPSGSDDYMQAMRSSSLSRASTQLGLFTDQADGPQGLSYSRHFISPVIEQELIRRIAGLPLQPFQFGAYEGKRRVQSFGFRYDYTQRRMQRAEPIPAWLEPLAKSVEQFGGPGTRVRQVLCTEYDVGVGIGWHRDKQHYDRVFGLSLGSAGQFRLRKSDGGKWQRFTLRAEPRSIYILSGEARSVWEHSIPGGQSPRYSITFRTMVGDNS